MQTANTSTRELPYSRGHLYRYIKAFIPLIAPPISPPIFAFSLYEALRKLTLALEQARCFLLKLRYRDYRRFDLLSRTESALDSHSERTFVLKQKARGRKRKRDDRGNEALCDFLVQRMTLLLRSISGLYGTEYSLQAANVRTKRGYFPPRKHQKHMLCWQYFRKYDTLYCAMYVFTSTRKCIWMEHSNLSSHRVLL